MSKAVGWIALGLAAGVLVSLVMRPSADVAENDPRLAATRVGGATIPTPSIREFEELARRVGRLESRIDELTVGLSETKRQPDSIGLAQNGAVAAEEAATAAFPSEGAQGTAERLLAGGFPADRAQWIASRSEELLMAQIEARYAAEREGEPLAMEALERLGPQYLLREDLDDWEYERYLQALGRPTSVGVVNVLANSPADRAGLRSGDRIVAYGGMRVFNVFEVTQLTREGTVGESVLVDIVRDDQAMQIIVPRGPLGAALSGNGLPGGVTLPSFRNQ